MQEYNSYNPLMDYVDHLNILIVDDETRVLENFKKLLEGMQGKYSLPPLNIRTAVSYDDASNRLFFEEFHADLILMDKELPDGDGIELCQVIKSDENFRGTMIYIVSGHVSDSAIRSAALEAGAISTIDKTTSEGALFYIILNSLDNLSKDKAISAMNRQKEQDLALAKALQKKLISQGNLPVFPGYTFSVLYEAMMEISGDLYEIRQADDDTIMIFLGDVSGHGVSAAIVGSMTKMALNIIPHEGHDPVRFLRTMNRHLYELISPYFITVFLGFLNCGTRELVYCNAGHPAPLLYSSTHGTVTELECSGTIIGSLENPSLAQATVRLEAGDELLVYSDGITECCNPDSEEYGIERLTAFMKQPRRPNHEILKELNLELRNFSQGRKFQDDITALLMKVR